MYNRTLRINQRFPSSQESCPGPSGRNRTAAISGFAANVAAHKLWCAAFYIAVSGCAASILRLCRAPSPRLHVREMCHMERSFLPCDSIR